MDSGNSGSLQSSSGAEEECNSRAVVHDHQPHPPPPLPFNNHHHHHNIMFDQNQINNPLLFTQQHQLVNNNNNLDSFIWSKTLPPFPTTDQQTTTTKTHPPHPDPDRVPGRNPKKRSRASRRAPTTVLTTDTSNFRAMVQEFTGIPAPPFPSSSNTFPARLSSTTSFDLFGRSMMMRSNTNTNTNYFDYNLGIPPNYPSFPQKLPTSLLLDSTNLLTTMQMQNTISSSSSSLYLNHKLTPQNGFGVGGQTQNIINHGLLHSTTLPDLVSTTTTTERNGGDQTASGKWNDGVNYSNEKAVDHHHHHGEPWVCSSD